MKLSLKRLLAYWLDFTVLSLSLIGIQYFLYIVTSGFPFNYLDTGLKIIVWVFASMSLPVWCYFIFFEVKRKRTFGKMLLKLEVSTAGNTITFKQGFLRTFIKLLPWELTHIIVLYPVPWWSGQEVSNFHLVLIPNVLMVIYIAVLFLSGGNKGLHDYIAKTEVVPR